MNEDQRRAIRAVCEGLELGIREAYLGVERADESLAGEVIRWGPLLDLADGLHGYASMWGAGYSLGPLEPREGIDLDAIARGIGRLRPDRLRGLGELTEGEWARSHECLDWMLGRLRAAREHASTETASRDTVPPRYGRQERVP